MSVSKTILLGNVGKDPEVRTVGESKVANFSLATSESYKNKAGERITNTEWHNIVVWGKRAEIVEDHVKKGSTLYIEGKNKTRKWQDKEGNDRYSTDVVIEQFGGELKFVGKKTESEPKPESQTDFSNEPTDPDDDLPF